ncbi:TPA: Cro/CI family transcriptional regulator [Klebsiella oxytoca]
MVTFTLKDYVAENGQVRAGKHLGVTQIAISKALRSGRSIFVQISSEGKVSAYETKPFPAKKNDISLR